MDHLLETVILLMLAVPGLRLVSSRAFRRVFPYDAFRVGLVTFFYLVVVALLIGYAPQWLPYPAIAAGVLAVFVAWRSRPGFGVSTGLPPGSLWPLPVRPWSDPEFYARQAQRYGSFFKLSQFGRPMVCVLGLERANRLLLEHDDKLEAPPLAFSRFIEGGYLRYLPEEVHSQYRLAFHALFHSEVLANAEPRIASVFRRRFESMVRTSHSVGSVLVRTEVLRAMFIAWSELFYGIDETHPSYARLNELFRIIDTRKVRWARQRRVLAALAEIEAMLSERVESFGDHERNEPSCFLAILARDNPNMLTDRTVMGNLIYIMQVTWGDVSGLLLWIFKKLSDEPAWRERMANERSRNLAERIVQETLRMEQSESRYRRALRDLEFDGVRIPKGWLVRMCIRESHRDPQLFSNPDNFDPNRFAGIAPTRSQYAPFGAGRLACIGENITKAVGALFALELATGFHWQVVDDGPAGLSSWVHNAPNPRLRVRMTAADRPADRDPCRV